MRSTAVQEQGSQEGLSSILVGVTDGVTVLDLLGEHDVSTADELSSMIAEQAALNRGVVVSLTETDFIDSSTVRVLFAGDLAMLAKGRRLVLHSFGEEPIERVLELSGLSEQLLNCDTLDEAVEFASQCFPQEVA